VTKSMTLSDFIVKEPYILLDGAMGTQLEAEGLIMGEQNCVTHPDTVLSVHRRYAGIGCHVLTSNTLTMNRLYMEIHGVDADVPLIAQPNAGKPRLAGGRTVFDMDPGAFAEGILECMEAGATMVGGCCGTTSEHIRRVAVLIESGGKGSPSS